MQRGYKKHSNTKKKKSKENETEIAPTSPTRSHTLNVEKTKCQEYDGSEKTQSYFQELKEDFSKEARKVAFIIAVLTLLVLGLYTCETHSTNGITKQQFQRGELPYVWITNDGAGRPAFFPDNPPAITGTMHWGVQYTNYGKSPAYGLHTEKFVSMGEGQPFSEAHKFNDHFGDGEPVPPGKVDIATAVSEEHVTADDFDNFIKD